MSSQTRGEALSLFYSETIFEVNVEYLLDSDETARFFMPWVHQIPHNQLQHLQHVELYSDRATSLIKLDYTKETGLKVEVDRKPLCLYYGQDDADELELDFDKLMWKFKDLVKGIETNRRVLGLSSGQAIVLAVTSACHIWEELYAEY